MAYIPSLAKVGKTHTASDQRMVMVMRLLQFIQEKIDMNTEYAHAHKKVTQRTLSPQNSLLLHHAIRSAHQPHV